MVILTTPTVAKEETLSVNVQKVTIALWRPSPGYCTGTVAACTCVRFKISYHQKHSALQGSNLASVCTQECICYLPACQMAR